MLGLNTVDNLQQSLILLSVAAEYTEHPSVAALPVNLIVSLLGIIVNVFLAFVNPFLKCQYKIF